MVLIIGGTGLVGSHLILEIYKKNLELRVTYRCKENLKNLKSCLSKYFKINSNYINSIDWVYANVIDITSLDDALKGVNFVYHCAAKVSLANYDKNELYKTNIEGTANVVNLCIKHKVKKLCYISSIASINPKKNVGMINEHHSWDDTKLYTFYAFSKYAAEKEVWRGSQEGLNVVIVNPGLILGGKFNNSNMKKTHVFDTRSCVGITCSWQSFVTTVTTVTMNLRKFFKFKCLQLQIFLKFSNF